MRSSYISNGYGELITKYVKAWQPVCAVELGVLDGYSTLAIARGIRNVDFGILHSYDLFENYKFKHGTKEAVQQLIDENKLTKHVVLMKGDAYKVHEDYPDESIQFLHIDISNTGKVVRDLMDLWHKKVSPSGLVMIEGGSKERDEIDWMRDYKMPSIKDELENNELINSNYLWSTYQPFPSLTVMVKRDDETQEPSSFLYGYGS